MIKLTLKLFIFFIFLTSCITVNYNPSVPEKKQEKVSKEKSSNIINPKPKSPQDKNRELKKLTENAGKALAGCLYKLETRGYITRAESDEFIKKVSRGLTVKNALLFATATKDNKFCVEMVPRFIDRDSYELDTILNNYWKSKGKRS